MGSFRGTALPCSVALLIATLAAVEGVAGEVPLASRAARAEPHASWAGERMNLGAPRDDATDAASADPMRRLGRCRRWRDAALGLGETFAGHSLRAALVSRHCALLDATESRHASVWSWPWSTLEVGHGLPPRLHRSFGQWQIRCGDGAERQRCALIHQVAVAPGGPPDDPPADVVTTHFVIDHVAGREILLWRLFVPRRTSGLLVSAAASAVTQDGGLTARLRIGLRRHSLRSTVCRAGGCMIEIGGTRAGKIATGLAAGHSLRLDLFTGKAGAIEAEIGAEGFAQGLVELIRQRRAERNLNAPR